LRPWPGSIRTARFVDLYAEYPDYRIDIDREQQRLREHDVIMFLFPLFWYSTPAILKEWQDLVLEHGFAYGSEGTALAGKFFIVACSAGGPAAAYEPEGYNHFTLRELLRPSSRPRALSHALPAAVRAVRRPHRGVRGRLPRARAVFTDLLDALASAARWIAGQRVRQRRPISCCRQPTRRRETARDRHPPRGVSSTSLRRWSPCPWPSALGLGSVLGYLVAGVVIGPVLGLVGSEESVTIQHYAEFGVVMMLFLVGLELEPAMLWRMRSRLLGLGGCRWASPPGCSPHRLAGGAGLAHGAGGGLLLSLSSTAIVLQTFQEKGLSKAEGGRSAFSVLLFQDIAVIPMLALIPSWPCRNCGPGAAMGDDGHHELSLVAGLSGWLYALVVLALSLHGDCRRPLPIAAAFSGIANTGLREAFTASALMLVIGIALLMSLVGLSPALGTFLAGVVLANSEFRHELETDIEPFKGLLLGLFFITVGAGVQFSVLADNLGLVLSLTLGVIAAKAFILFVLALLFRIRRADGWLFTLSLAQAGEFGFVLISYASQNSVLPPALVPVLSLVVALSMFLTPLLFIAFEQLVLPRYAANETARESDAIDDAGTVIIAGIGRFGQIVNRMLRANDIPTVVLDRTPQQIDNMREVKIKSYYGDATRPDLLHAAGIEDAALFVVAIDDQEQAIALTRYLKHAHPNLKVLARAYDRGHLYALREAGADWVVSETYHSALQLGKHALRALQYHPFRAEKLTAAFDRAEDEGRDALYAQWLKKDDGERFGRGFRSLYIELEEALAGLMVHDRDDAHERGERGWMPPPRGYTREIGEES
jgi:Kef-type K+ transport system membrane component KefB/NAD(P)H-dependent FMN reductase